MAHTYDTAGRLAGVTSGAGTFTYGYVTDSPLLSGVSGPQATTTYAYEADRDLRTEVLNKVGSTTVSRYGYRSDPAGRRKDRVQEGTAFPAVTYDRFAYNPRGEVTQSKNFTGTNPDAAADPENPALARLYGYDVIGNRLTSTVGTATARAYTSNALNQYTAITNPAATPAYDLDGNQTVTGTGWHYEWDAENRLSLARDYATSPVNGSKKVEYTYDYRSRRIRRTESTYNAGAWAVADDRKFLYEGWNLLGEFATGGFARICSYTWGLDLSQSPQGAGGVGGLLAVTTVTPSAGNFFATYDGNGNVSEYINGSGGIEAHFEYDAFGDVTRTTGTDLGRFNHRFSTKYWDATVALNYYGFRYYNPSTGRWPNRDPHEEKGGANLYGFVRNEAFTNVDFLGLALTPYTEDPTTIPVRESSRILARADGEAGIEWPPSVARVVGKKVHLEGKLVLRPTYQPGVDPNAWSGVDIFRQTVAEHERYHGLIAKSSWNGNLKIVDFWEGEYCTAACAALAGDLADAWNRYGYWQDKIRQAEYDISSYGDLSEQPRARKQIAIGGANREMDVIRDRRDRFFNVLRCVEN